MSAVVIVGAQWGDEGKGKATDLLGPRADYVVKPNGGNNAGHTVVVNGQKFELKLLPAGILSENATPVIGNGVVVNPEALFSEIEGLQARGADTPLNSKSRQMLTWWRHITRRWTRSPNVSWVSARSARPGAVLGLPIWIR